MKRDEVGVDKAAEDLISTNNRRGGLLWVGLVLTLAGCGQVLGLDDYHAHSEGGGTDVALHQDGSDASSSDGGRDAFTRWCSAPHLFCEDFDSHPLGEMWSVTAQDIGPLKIDSTDSISPPNSLYVTFDASPSVGQGTYLLKQVLGPVSIARVHTQLKLDQAGVLGTDSDVQVFSLTMNPVPPEISDYSLVLTFSGTTAFLDENVNATTANVRAIDHQIHDSFAMWRELVIQLDMTQSPWVLTIMVDGQTVVNAPSVVTLATQSNRYFDLQVGGVYVSALTRPWELHFDDVSFDGSN